MFLDGFGAVNILHFCKSLQNSSFRIANYEFDTRNARNAVFEMQEY